MIITVTSTTNGKTKSGAVCKVIEGIGDDNMTHIINVNSRFKDIWDVLDGQQWDISWVKYGGQNWANSINPYHPIKSTESQKQATESKSEPPKTQTKSIPSEDKMSKEDWAYKDKITRKSIERQTALNNAVIVYTEAAKLNQLELKTDDIIKLAKRYEKYLETGE